MKEAIKYSLILSSICLVASALLAGVYTLTKFRIEAQAQTEIETSLKQVLPLASRFEPVTEDSGEVLYYKGLDNKDRLAGIVFSAQGKGYSSAIETMVGMLPTGEIVAIKVISQNETPGLGTRVSEKAFTGQFAKKSIEGLSEVSAISGATISSKAVINSVKLKAKEIKKYLK